MKNLSLFLVISFLLASCGGGGSSSGLDQTKPESVVKAVFDAAKTGNYAVLSNLCDPMDEGDGDTKRICKVASEDADKAFLEEFTKYFKDGKVTGDAKIEGDHASVPIAFGPGGEEEETIKLVKRDGKWYLYSF